MTFLTAIIGSLYVTALVTIVFIVLRFIVRGILFLNAARAGAPFVATKADIDRILLAQPIQSGSRFLEIGCGDGRVVIRASELLQIEGVGIDIDPLLIAQAKRNAQNISRPPHFEVANSRDFDTTPYDTFYLFLLPKLLTDVTKKLLSKRAGKPILIISHAFKITSLESHLVHVEPGTPYETYYYHIQ